MGVGWVRDVRVDSTPLSTTGGHTWAAAYRLADYLEACASTLGLCAPHTRILELGAGCGWLGCTLARNLPDAGAVLLTEQEQGGALDWLVHNVALNKAAGVPLGAVATSPCDWRDCTVQGSDARRQLRCDDGAEGSGSCRCMAEARFGGDVGALALGGATGASSLPRCCTGAGASGDADRMHTLHIGSSLRSAALHSGHWDFIIGSDLIYNHEGSRCLPRVLAALAAPCTKILYCHTKHRFDLLDIDFFEGLARCGLQCEEVAEPGASPPPQSPPQSFPPADLFPEQRICVYYITRAAP